eukprot:gene55890-32241_t
MNFALVGCCLFGRHVSDFTNLAKATAWLAETVFISPWTPVVDTMMEMEPILTRIYLIFFYILSWILLLNAVVGVLAA